MPTDTARPRALSFVLRLIVGSLTLFGVLRLAWVGTHILLPVTRLQAAMGSALLGPSTLPIEATLACSGADALSLFLATILAYPARWRWRLMGAASGAAGLLLLNVLRIGTLGRAAGSPHWFNLLHVYVWPAILTVAIAGFVFGWMRIADKARPERALRVEGRARGRIEVRFVLLATAGLVAFVLAGPLYLGSARLLAVAEWIAAAAAGLLQSVGLDATAAAGILATPRGAFRVTQECIATPLIPVYLAAVLTYGRTWRVKALGVVAAVPAFIALGIARLLVVAVPGLGGGPAFFVHAFSQLLVAAGLVAALAFRRSGWRIATLARVALAASLACVWAVWLGGPYTHAIVGLSARTPALDDPQSARMFLPAFQSGLFFACGIAGFAPGRSARFLCGAALLGAIQIAFAATVQALGVSTGVVPPVLMIRGWALLGPILVLAAVMRVRRHADDTEQNIEYRNFWRDVGAHFPDLGGAASTTFYYENEQRLIRAHLGTLANKRVLKTDLWDEARNTRILQWIQREGARVVGVDISMPVVQMAGSSLAAANADVRALPFAAGSFDAVYSMGTIEHFAETEAAVREIYRVIKPGGRALIGVPNRRDPFLRPLLVAILYRVGLYGYGYEKSYSRKSLRRMLEGAGFAVTADDGILFMPGWLRMLDLLCHTRYPATAPVTAAAVRVFRWIDARVPAVRRHGYLIVAIGDRPR